METKEQKELRRVGRYFAYTGKPTDDGSIDYGKVVINPHEFHPLWYRIKMLYDLLKGKNGPHHYVNRILLDIQQYGIKYKVKKVDLIAMNKIYKEYK